MLRSETPQLLHGSMHVAVDALCQYVDGSFLRPNVPREEPCWSPNRRYPVSCPRPCWHNVRCERRVKSGTALATTKTQNRMALEDERMAGMGRSWGRYLTSLLVLAVVAVSAGSTREGEPTVKVFLVVPPDTKPFEDAAERLTLVLKDIQWWYSCQMEAHGYGAKTFPLELTPNGQVQIHLVRLGNRQPGGEDKRIQFKVQQACLAAARTTMGSSPPKGTIMLVVYNGYIWRNREEHAVWPCGTGRGGEWAFLTAYHYSCICPAAWNVETPLADYTDPAGYFSEGHMEIMRGHYTYKRSDSERKLWLRRPVGLHAVLGHGILAHEIGRAIHPIKGTAAASPQMTVAAGMDPLFRSTVPPTAAKNTNHTSPKTFNSRRDGSRRMLMSPMTVLNPTETALDTRRPHAPRPSAVPP